MVLGLHQDVVRKIFPKFLSLQFSRRQKSFPFEPSTSNTLSTLNVNTRKTHFKFGINIHVECITVSNVLQHAIGSAFDHNYRAVLVHHQVYKGEEPTFSGLWAWPALPGFQPLYLGGSVCVCVYLLSVCASVLIC